jgi:NAD(P)-dependent dehydrogenase (short-subunit alcohol dehydrogenase family)
MGLLDGKVAIVTGSAHGIGRGHALELAKHGATVIVNDLGGSVQGEGRGKDADEVVGIIKAGSGRAVANYGDVSDENDAKALIAQAVDEFGRLDILVNNAGNLRDRSIWNMTPADFDAVIRVHLRGTWLLCHFASQHWRERSRAGEAVNGRIINTTSGAGLIGNFGQSNYASAKAAIAGLTLTLSLELKRLGVTVNCIGPAAATRLSAGVVDVTPHEPDEYEPDVFNRSNPAVSSPVVAWLASDEAQYVTGQVIRAVGDKLFLMKPWFEAREVSSGEKYWDAEKLGEVFATDIFGSRAPGLQI